MVITNAIMYLVTLISIVVSLYFLKEKFPSTVLKRNDKALRVTVGIGILFPFVLLVGTIIFECTSTLFIVGLILLSGISFLDDIKPLGVTPRFCAQLFACALVVYELISGISLDNIIIYILTFGFIISYLNAYNFMDGINGMLGLHTMLIFLTLFYMNIDFHFENPTIIIALIIVTGLFLYGNFRKRPRFISGDVGSITLGFVIGYYIVKIYFTTKNPTVFLLTALYFIETGSTLFLNLRKGISFTKSHRNHLYEILVFKFNNDDLRVSFFYGLVQLVISSIVLFCLEYQFKNWAILCFVTMSLLTIYIIFRAHILKNEPRKTTTN